MRIVLELKLNMKSDTNMLDFNRLVTTIRQAHDELAKQASRAVNLSLTLRNWLIGCYIAEYELRGSDRANYGDRLLSELSGELRRPQDQQHWTPAVILLSGLLPCLPSDCADDDRTNPPFASKRHWQPKFALAAKIWLYHELCG